MKEYATVTYADLPKHGIKILTGEACAYSMRLLCDLNQKGVDLIQEFLGITLADNSASNWNSMVYEEPAVKSVMLSHTVLNEIRKFILVHKLHFPVIAEKNGEITGMTEEFYEQHSSWMNYSSGQYIVTRHRVSNQPVDGSRNVHAFSGRSV